MTGLFHHHNVLEIHLCAVSVSLFKFEYYSIGAEYKPILLICSSIYGYLSCFYLLALVNSDAMNTGCADISLKGPNFNTFGYILKSGIAETHGNSIFNFLQNCHSVFHSDCTPVRAHKQCTRVPVSPHPRLHLFL